MSYVLFSFNRVKYTIKAAKNQADLQNINNIFTPLTSMIKYNHGKKHERK